jgi:hypothetical protein
MLSASVPLTPNPPLSSLSPQKTALNFFCEGGPSVQFGTHRTLSELHLSLGFWAGVSSAAARSAMLGRR